MKKKDIEDINQNLEDNKQEQTSNQEDIQDTNESQEEIQDTNENQEESKTDELAELKDKYIRLVAEFDNYRKRTNKEKFDLINSASEQVMLSILEVIDDTDRADEQIRTSQDVEALRQGVLLIFNKLKNVLQSKGLKEMESTGTVFDPELHEAITEIPAPKSKLKGKVIDTVQKGYYLNDKIIRHAKVVVGK